MTSHGRGKLEMLEAVRGAAALYVFLHHSHILPNVGIGHLLYFGQEAVIVFFLLSGFVIFYSCARSRPTIGQYLLARARRIYPVFGFSLLLAYLSACAIAGKWLSPKFDLLAANLLMLQDVSALKPGVWFDTYYGNSPLWSLSYEWWFYMAFVPLSLSRAVPRRIQLPSSFAISLLGFVTYCAMPNQISLFASYLLIWWAGVELARDFVESGAVQIRRQLPILGAMLVMTLLWGANAIVLHAQGIDFQFGVYPYLQVRHYAAASLLLGALLIAPATIHARVPKAFKPLLWIAPVSYFLYAAHQPIINLFDHFMPSSMISARVIMALIATLTLGWLIEVGTARLPRTVFFQQVREQ